MKIADVFINDQFIVRMMLCRSGYSILENEFDARVISSIEVDNKIILNMISNNAGDNTWMM